MASASVWLPLFPCTYYIYGSVFLGVCRYSLNVGDPAKDVGSFWGGFDAEVAGWGFVPSDDAGQYEQVRWFVQDFKVSVHLKTPLYYVIEIQLH